MKVFTEMFMSKEEKAIRRKHQAITNEENPPIATDVELIVDHSVWHKGKEHRTFGQGPLYLVVDGEKETRSKEGATTDQEGEEKPPEISQEQITAAVPEGFRTSGLSVYRVGTGMNVLVPSFMGTHFMKQGKFSHTVEGKKRVGYIMMALLVLSYLFLIIYLPKSNEINESEMIAGHYAQLIYLAAFLIGFFGWWYGKKTTANRIKLQCFDPQRCDLHDIHVGIFTCAKYTPEQQIAWWTNSDIPRSAIDRLNQDLLKQNRSYQTEVVKLTEDVTVFRNLGIMKAVIGLIREGFLLKDDSTLIFYRRITFFLLIVIMLFAIWWTIGGA